MTEVRCTLLADGKSDRRLLRPLEWLFGRLVRADVALQLEFADFSAVRDRPTGLSARIRLALELYPCEILFVHRDAERDPPQRRYDEIQETLAECQISSDTKRVAIVPVRMQEAWFLFDEAAIRTAAGNPKGTDDLTIPTRNVESLPDPKAVLYEALRVASGLKGRKREKFSVRQAAYRLADLIRDFSPLRSLPAFRRLENDLQQVVADMQLG